MESLWGELYDNTNRPSPFLGISSVSGFCLIVDVSPAGDATLPSVCYVR